jgi:hypothetical protein
MVAVAWTALSPKTENPGAFAPGPKFSHWRCEEFAQNERTTWMPALKPSELAFHAVVV